MHVSLDREFSESSSLVDFHVDPSAPVCPEPPSSAEASEPPSRYGVVPGRPRWVTITAIAAAHLALLAALVELDVVPLQPRPEAPLVVTLIALDSPPPPEAPPPPEKAPTPPPVEAVVVPRVEVSAPVLAPPTLVSVTPAPLPAASVPEAPAAPAAAPVNIPVTQPDGMAASLNNPAPRYPLESRRKREEGTVRLRVVITPDGRVKEINVFRSSGYERLDRAALDAVRKWRFLPGTRGGQPVEAVGTLAIPFKLT